MNRFLVCLTTFAVATAAHAQVSPPLAPVPENLGLGLRQLVEISQSDQAELKRRMGSAPSVNADNSGRVVVNIQLNGAAPLQELEAKLVELGLEIIATDSQWRAGVISAWLPLSQAIAAANLPGVRSITLAPRPVRRVGAVTAESSVVERSGEVNTPGTVTAQGILGRGINIGIISDSYDTASGVPRASVGVAAGDLPGPGNPDGYTQPVVVLKDDTSTGVTDEGRGMAEIVHDIAPAAKICFSTSGATQASMAASIRNLRTSSQTLCDVIVDDIGFADEPFFSDGLLSQAIDDVATSNSLAGKKVAYFSAAGNSTNRGYTADANIISPNAAQASHGNLKLNSVPPSLYAGGFQNLNATGTPAIIMTVTTDTDPVELVFQWDDPFNTGGVTTDYNLLVFSSTGNYLGNISGTDNNFSTSEPVEIVDLHPSTTYQIVISLASSATPTARHLRLIAYNGTVTGDYLTSNVISIFGHPSATNANAVAAYLYDNTPNVVTNFNPAKNNPPPGPYEPVVESFNARGGSLPFYFDSQGQRLSSPEIRLKPELAAADGVDTSFFPTDAGSDTDNDGYPNFFGTSAAAPNAAAFAALLLEAAGGPTSLTPAQVRTFLRQSTFPHDLDPYNSAATITASGRSVNLTAAGDDSNESATSPNFFTLTFNGQSGDNLSQVVIDLSNTAVIFDPRTDLGFPFTVGQASPGLTVTPSLSSDMRTLTLSFSGFTPGKSISFGIDRDLAAISAGGNSADVLGGASVSAVINGQTFYGAFVNQLGTGFIPTDGNGLIDARVAVEAIVGKKAGSGGAAVNLSTRGNVGAGENVLIGGLIIEGSASKKLILRAIGPSLTAAGVSGALSDPLLELHDANGQLIAADDNWQDDPAQAVLIRGTGIPPNDPRESALVETLSAGNYTVIVRGANNATGIGLVEAYDLDSQPAASRLANIATRGTVQTGDSVMIAGFILQQGASRIVVRAPGPSLTAAGISGALPDPSLELRDSQGNLLLADDNWQEHAFHAVQLTAVGLSPTAATESALTTTLNSGNYTAIVRGSHGTTGVALVEVYNLH
jgi:Subtilase family